MRISDVNSLKERIHQAIYDMLDELEADPSWTTMATDDEARQITDAVYSVLTDTEGDEVDLGIGDTVLENIEQYTEEPE